jgi:hypothetical protein
VRFDRGVVRDFCVERLGVPRGMVDDVSELWPRDFVRRVSSKVSRKVSSRDGHLDVDAPRVLRTWRACKAHVGPEAEPVGCHSLAHTLQPMALLLHPWGPFIARRVSNPCSHGLPRTPGRRWLFLDRPASYLDSCSGSSSGVSSAYTLVVDCATDECRRRYRKSPLIHNH